MSSNTELWVNSCTVEYYAVIKTDNAKVYILIRKYIHNTLVTKASYETM